MNAEKIRARRGNGRKLGHTARPMRPGIPVGPWTPRTKAPSAGPEPILGSPRPGQSGARPVGGPGRRVGIGHTKRAARLARKG